MYISTAERLIDNLVYKPGWRFEVSDHRARFENAIAVKISYPAHETSPEMAEQGYPEENNPYATFPLMLDSISDKDDAMLYRAITHMIMKIEEHEMREYLRTKPTYRAPFHPHKTDGINAWIDTKGVCQEWERLSPDMQFGIA